MPKIEIWNNFPEAVKQHLVVERMRDRSISIADLNQLRLCPALGRRFRKASGARTSVLSRFLVAAHSRSFKTALLTVELVWYRDGIDHHK